MPPLAPVPDLEHELDALYALPLEEFTRARNDLAARLRKAHQAEAADSVRALRKPSLVVWTANRLAHLRPELTAELVSGGERLREVQQRAIAGGIDPAELAEATAGERAAVRALLAAAREELAGRATAALLDRLGQTLRGAALDPGLAGRLAAGRLTEELAAVGFGPLQAVEQRSRRDEVRRLARERVAELRGAATRLAAEAAAAEQAAAAAEREAGARRVEAEDAVRLAGLAAAELAAAEADLTSRR
jgi:hypothetical protein